MVVLRLLQDMAESMRRPGLLRKEQGQHEEQRQEQAREGHFAATLAKIAIGRNGRGSLSYSLSSLSD